MKKIFSLFLSMLAVCVIGASVYAAETGYITTTATTQVELTPDVVDFDVEIVTTSKDSMNKAINENKTVSAKVYNNLKKAIEGNEADSLKTSNYNATPVYRYSNGKRYLDYYQVTNTVKVHTKKIDKVGSMMDKAIADGATSVNNISYSVSEYDAECQKLLAKTAVKAKTQAMSIIKELESEYVGVRSIDGSCSMSGSNMPRMVMSMKASVNDAVTETSTNIEVGKMTLTARVTASFYLK